MKIIINSIFFLILITSSLKSQQPIISYILPDIVAPDIPVYIEIIGPYNNNGNFGSDIFSLNNPNDKVRIEPFNLLDTNKLTFGPLVVSWNGRMISTTVFVKPNVDPNSWDWTQLDNEFKIPIRVYVDGKGYSNVDTLYIVRPFPASDWSGIAENIIGQGQLGKRSRRGAMIFESLTLGNREYRVSTNDCDPKTDGNQGYLPFTLLVKNELKGGSNTFINVSGGLPARQDAGPGGGGGGGKFCDGTTFGDDGGNGFVAGGPGGRNNSGLPLVTNEFKNYGQSSGANNTSLNGVPAPPKGQYEASGGATGHPFGASGEPCFDGNNCEGNGGFGGGAGNKQLNDGGSAGYSEDGIGPFKSGGRKHGNVMIVPIAGGSGGASGNPQGLGTCSGNGGGGGGAISVFAKSIDGVSIRSDGAAGENAPADGGGGSGGSILVYSKLPYANFKLSASGGKAGNNNYNASNGRIRLDVFGENNGELLTSLSPFRGFATDSSNYVFRKFKLTGRKDFQKQLNLFIKSPNSEWKKLTDITTDPSLWSEIITLPGSDSIYYLVAAQQINNSLSAPYQFEPNTIFSQAGLNILKIVKAPSLVCDSIVIDRKFRCSNFPVNYNLKLYNYGDADLEAEFQNAKFLRNNQGFTLNNPKGFKRIKPNDSTEILVSFFPPNNFQSRFTDTLVFSHNDPFTINPFKIVFDVSIDTILITIQEKGKEKPITINYKGLDTLDFGKICYVNNIEKDFTLQNFSSNNINLASIQFKNNFFKVSGFQPFMQPNKEQYLKISTNINKYGRIFDTMYVKVADCPNYEQKFYVTVFIDSVALKFTGNSNFGNVNLGISKTTTIKIHNNGSVSAQVNDLNDIFLMTNQEFKIISIKPDLPVILRPYLDTLYVDIQFTPNEEKPYQDQLILDTKFDCPRQDRLVLSGRGVVSKVYISSLMLDFGFGSKCDDKELSFYIKNLPDASTDLIILNRAKILGPDRSNFTIAQEPGNLPLTLKPGDSAEYYVRYTAIEGGPGIKTAYIEIPTSDTKFPTIKIDLTAEREDLVIDIVPNDTIDVGNIFTGFEKNVKMFLANAGRLDHYIFDTRINSPNVSVFPFGGWLNKNKDNQLEFDFKIIETSGGLKEYNVIFIVSNPCYDTLHAVIKANSIPSTATIPNKIDFQTLYPCETKRNSFVIENSSEGPFIVRSISSIQGNFAGAYKFVGKLPNLPDTLWKGMNRTFIVEVDPSNFDDGTLDAYIEIVIYINGKEETRRIQLTAERKSGMLITPTSLDFGGVVINTFASLQLRFENVGVWDIDNISVSAPTFFTTNYTGVPIPQFNLGIGQNKIIDITFAPTNIQDYIDSIQVAYSVRNCPPDSIWIKLIGKGIPAKNFTLWLPEITTEPTNSNLQIPIYAKLEKSGESLSNFNLDTLTIEFDRSLFYLEKIQSMNAQATFETYLNNETRGVKIKLNNIKLSDQDTVLAILQGSALLGNKESTPLKITKVAYLQKALVSKIDTISGLLKITYCSEGGNRFLEFSNNSFALQINPIPTTDFINVNFQIIEKGVYSIYLIDELGKSTILDEIELSPSSNSLFSKNYNLSMFPVGPYRLLIQTPTQIYSANLLIVR